MEGHSAGPTHTPARPLPRAQGPSQQATTPHGAIKSIQRIVSSICEEMRQDGIEQCESKTPRMPGVSAVLEPGLRAARLRAREHTHPVCPDVTRIPCAGCSPGVVRGEHLCKRGEAVCERL